MRSTFVLKRRQGRSQGELKPSLPENVEQKSQPEGIEYAASDRRFGGVIQQRTTWRVSPTGIEEETALSTRWGLLLWSGLVLIGLGLLSGSLSVLDPILALGLRITGLAFVVFALTEAMHAGYAANQPWVLDTVNAVETPYAGVLAIVLTLVLITVGGGTTIISVLAWSGASLLVTGYLLTSSVDDLFAELSARLTTIERRYPVAARQHVLCAGAGAASLMGFAAIYLEIHVSNPFVGGLVGALCLTGISWLLWSLDPGARQRARINVSGAVVLTGLFVVGLPLITRPSITVPQAFDSRAAIAGQLLIVGSLLTIWVLLGRHLVVTQSDAASRFLSMGRQIDTATAAVLAYAIMVSSAALGLAALVFLGTLYYVILQTGTPIPILVAVVCALPLGYYITGSALQFRGLVQQMVELRRRGNPQSASDLDLPFEPTHTLWIVDEEGFLAGAYYDPFLSAIVLSRGAVEQLTPAQRAAVVAHEESHFKHRGAFLQFIFTLACSFTLLGKNVVFSVYDFREREFTADEYAVNRLSEHYPERSLEIFISLLNIRQEGEVEPSNSPLAGFFPTLQWSPQHISEQGGAVFAQFYGTFAGQVHPSDHEREQYLLNEYQTSRSLPG